MRKRFPVSRRWARLGPENPSALKHVPEAGVCLSAFLIVKRNGSILLGRPHSHSAWPLKGGFPRWRAAELEKRDAWLLPATNLMMEEAPNRAARRIVNEWGGLEGKPRFVMIQSHLQPAGRLNHWAICFVYELHVRKDPTIKPWWSEMRFVKPSEIRRMKLGRGHRDILQEAHII